MCRHLIAGAAAKPGDRFDSPFTSRLILPEMDENCIHNDAWYSLEKLTTQRRYDPIRETPRFRAIESHLREFAK